MFLFLRFSWPPRGKGSGLAESKRIPLERLRARDSFLWVSCFSYLDASQQKALNQSERHIAPYTLLNSNSCCHCQPPSINQPSTNHLWDSIEKLVLASCFLFLIRVPKQLNKLKLPRMTLNQSAGLGNKPNGLASGKNKLKMHTNVNTGFIFFLECNRPARNNITQEKTGTRRKTAKTQWNSTGLTQKTPNSESPTPNESSNLQKSLVTQLLSFCPRSCTETLLTFDSLLNPFQQLRYPAQVPSPCQ